MDYRMISADDHLDLQYLPPDLWTARLPKSLRDRAPHVEGRDGSAAWVCDGGTWGRWAGTYRLAKKGGLRQANLQIAGATPRIHDEAWEPLWTAFEETGLIMSFHVVVFGVGGRLVGVPAHVQDTPAGVFNTTKLFMGQFLDPFVDLFGWGILERHPKLRLVMAESGVGWLPWIVQELDYRFWRLWEAKEYWDQRGGITHTLKPSELFRRQVWVSFQDDCVAMSLLELYGEGHLLWASDYPHPDSTWPNSRSVIEKQMGDLSPEVRKQLTRDNAAALYSL